MANSEDPDQTAPFKANSEDPDQTAPFKANSEDPDQTAPFKANSEDPDQTALIWVYTVCQKEQSDLGLHCLPRSVCPNT